MYSFTIQVLYRILGTRSAWAWDVTGLKCEIGEISWEFEMNLKSNVKRKIAFIRVIVQMLDFSYTRVKYTVQNSTMTQEGSHHDYRSEGHEFKSHHCHAANPWPSNKALNPQLFGLL